jgi:hypothetical protein
MDRAPHCKHEATARPAVAAVAFALLAAGFLGCSDPEGDCEDLCAKEAQCASYGDGTDTGAIPFDEESCRSTCTAFAEEDPAFLDGVAERSACLDEQLDQGYGCFPCTFEGT